MGLGLCLLCFCSNCCSVLLLSFFLFFCYEELWLFVNSSYRPHCVKTRFVTPPVAAIQLIWLDSRNRQHDPAQPPAPKNNCVKPPPPAGFTQSGTARWPAMDRRCLAVMKQGIWLDDDPNVSLRCQISKSSSGLFIRSRFFCDLVRIGIIYVYIFWSSCAMAGHFFNHALSS